MARFGTEEIARASDMHVSGEWKGNAADTSISCGGREGPLSSEMVSAPGGPTEGCLDNPRACDPGASRTSTTHKQLTPAAKAATASSKQQHTTKQ